MSWDREYFEPTDKLETRRTLTWILVAVSICGFVAEFLWEGVVFRVSRYDSAFLRALALSPIGVIDRLRLWQILTHAFVQPNPVTLLFNMLVLYWFGQIFEELHGARKLAALFFGGILVSALTFTVLGYFAFKETVLFGPRGGLMAVMVAAAILWPDMPVLCLIVKIRLKWLVLILVGLDIYDSVMFLGVGSLAHLAAGAWGLLYWKYHERVFSALEHWDEVREEKSRASSAAEERDFSNEVDRILAKIAKDGMPSLTNAEKKVLEKASRKRRSS